VASSSDIDVELFASLDVNDRSAGHDSGVVQRATRRAVDREVVHR
jgi:hypothetical protein